VALISSIPKAKNEKQEAKQGGPIIGKDVPTKKWWVENNQAEKQNSTATTGKNGSTFPNSLYPRPEHDLSKVVVGTQDTDTKTETDKVGTKDDPIQQYVDLISKSNSSIPDLTATFKTNNEQAMKQSQTLSNNVYNREKDIYGLGKDLYYDQKNFNPLEADWAKQLLNYYGIESGEAADNARATGAADNGGNVDSYAAANAERQRLSKLNAGVNSISGMSQNRFNNMLATLQSIGVNTAELFGIEQKNTQAALENAGKTGELAVSANETQTAADLQNNQILADLYAAIYGGGTAEGEDSGHDYAKNPPSAEDTRAAITDLVESGAYDINDIDGIVEHMTKNYPDFSNWEGYIRSIHKRMVPNMEEPTQEK
jgi:hypothetical protein